jgi:hypothetical protein
MHKAYPGGVRNAGYNPVPSSNLVKVARLNGIVEVVGMRAFGVLKSFGSLLLNAAGTGLFNLWNIVITQAAYEPEFGLHDPLLPNGFVRLADRIENGGAVILQAELQVVRAHGLRAELGKKVFSAANSHLIRRQRSSLVEHLLRIIRNVGGAYKERTIADEKLGMEIRAREYVDASLDQSLNFLWRCGSLFDGLKPKVDHKGVSLLQRQQIGSTVSHESHRCFDTLGSFHSGIQFSPKGVIAKEPSHALTSLL